VIDAVCHDHHPDSLHRQRVYQPRAGARIADGKERILSPCVNFQQQHDLPLLRPAKAQSQGPAGSIRPIRRDLHQIYLIAGRRSRVGRWSYTVDIREAWRLLVIIAPPRRDLHDRKMTVRFFAVALLLVLASATLRAPAPPPPAVGLSESAAEERTALFAELAAAKSDAEARDVEERL
jgi:hypothetical protein